MRRHCPKCGKELTRVHRRKRDRLLSRINRVHRYLCVNPGCGWEGNLGFTSGSERTKKETALYYLVVVIYCLALGRAVVKVVDFLIVTLKPDTSE